jgi:hypothetical protein
VSVGPNPPVDVNTIEQTRRQIQRLFEEVARLSDLDLPPNDYFGEFLKRVLTALAAPAGAVWMRTAQGNLQLQFQINLQQVGLARTEEARQAHDELLRAAFQQPRPLHLPPHSSAGQGQPGQTAAGNPTDLILLLVPIQVENQVEGLLEVWQSPDRNPNAIAGFMQFMTEMAQLASRYLRNRLMRQMVGQQELWTKLEGFARQIHGSLNPLESAYVIANEGRRLIDCDRISVGVRQGRKCRVEAVSGADVVERRSNLVQLMQKLFDRVLAWGEKLTYTGTKDEGLPPPVLKALDAYLAESNSKVLVVLPLRDEREKESKKRPRSALMLECFEPQASPEQLIARLEVVGRHAAPALYNCVEHYRIPFRFLWRPLARIQEGLGGKARAIAFLILFAVVALIGAMYFVRYPLKVEARGELLPEDRVFVFPITKGHVQEFAIEPGARVRPGGQLLLIFDQELADKIKELDKEIDAARGLADAVEGELKSTNLTREQKTQLELQLITHQATWKHKNQLRRHLLEALNAVPDRPGFFWILAPRFPDERQARDAAGLAHDAEPLWTVLTPDFKENLRRRMVEPRDMLVRLGHKEGRWELELKIPQKHMGQVLYAFDYQNTDTLDVDIIVKSDPTRTYRGKLERSKLATEASPHRDANDEPEPVVLAWVRIEGDDILPEDMRIPRDLAPAGTEVKVKIRCGNHRMGYSLFYGVWEFLYEKVVFFF